MRGNNKVRNFGAFIEKGMVFWKGAVFKKGAVFQKGAVFKKDVLLSSASSGHHVHLSLSSFFVTDQ